MFYSYIFQLVTATADLDFIVHDPDLMDDHGVVLCATKEDE